MARPGDQTAYFSFGGDGSFQIDGNNQSGGRLVVLDNGNVGIGAPIPEAKLEVNGDVLVDGNAFIRGALVIYCSGPTANPDLMIAGIK